MSVNGILEKYELQKYVKGTDAYGNPTNTWVKVKDIEVAVSMTHDIVTNNDLSYRVQTPTGLTMYTGLVSNNNYRIIGDRTYTIESYYKAGRWVQLNLKAVI